MKLPDLGKQYGPLPLGAWIIVVGGGLGIAWYTRQNSSNEPIEVEDTSGVPGVGTGAVGGWVPTSPTTGITTPTITTNEEWGKAAIDWLIASGYDATVADSAIRKYLAGTKQSIQEYTLTRLALTKFGSPPQLLPPSEEDPPTIPPPTTDPPATVGKPGKPTILNAFSPARGQIKVNMRFGANTARVSIKDNGGPVFNPLAATLAGNVGGTTQYINVTPGRTYYLGVRAYNSAGDVSSQSNIVAVKAK